jgi:hypothetical protein
MMPDIRKNIAGFPDAMALPENLGTLAGGCEGDFLLLGLFIILSSFRG